jgi:CheY-like chemotaxis protein
MDIQMPGLDGFEATFRLREANYDKPILALTAHAMQGEKEKCIRAGFNDHLTKPVNRAALIRAVKQFSSKGSGETLIH